MLLKSREMWQFFEKGVNSICRYSSVPAEIEEPVPKHKRGISLLATTEGAEPRNPVDQIPNTVVVRPFRVVQSRPDMRLKPRTTFLHFEMPF